MSTCPSSSSMYKTQELKSVWYDATTWFGFSAALKISLLLLLQQNEPRDTMHRRNRPFVGHTQRALVAVRLPHVWMRDEETFLVASEVVFVRARLSAYTLVYLVRQHCFVASSEVRLAKQAVVDKKGSTTCSMPCRPIRAGNKTNKKQKKNE